jgi:MarR family transcriptional regulator, organic hydroperoxide resistance regulator
VTERDSFEQFVQSFKAAMAAVRRLRGRETHRPGELSYAQYGLLFSLAAGGALSGSELALAADVSQASATQMLDALEKAGLVERARSGEDRRVVLTSLTERGRQVVESRRALLEPRWRAAVSEFSDRDLLTAAEILDRIAEMFDELADRPEDDAGLTSAA